MDAHKHLVLDSRVIKSVSGARLALGSVVKHPGNPIFRGAGASVSPPRTGWTWGNMYPNVLYDESEQRYRMWYGRRLPDKGRETVLCYAYSDDGYEWITPRLGRVTYKGTSENNLLLRDIHGVGVYKDDSDKDPRRRYKLIGRRHFGEDDVTERMVCGTSEDGLHWTVFPVPEMAARGDTHNNVIWDAKAGCYVAISRLRDRVDTTETAGGDDVQWNPEWGERVVGRSESRDFRHWSPAVEVLRGRGLHDQVYSMPIFRYEGLYIGLASIFHLGNPDAEDWDKVTCELVWSPDTIHWTRLLPGQSFIPLGSSEGVADCAFDAGCIYASRPVVLDDEIRIYYYGSHARHSEAKQGALGLARARLDGFACYQTDETGGVGHVTTSLLTPAGATLKVSADVAGELRVAVLDATGDVVPGYALEDCTPIRGNVTDHEVHWQGRTLGSIGVGRVSLQFELCRAKLYAFAGLGMAS